VCTERHTRNDSLQTRDGTVTHRAQIAAALALSATAACGGGRPNSAATQTDSNTPAVATQAAPTSDTAVRGTAYHHHSALAGAALGAAAGHVLGGHAVLGAAAGALIQHERNKHQTAHP
jgi:hypothetical protein